MAKAGDKSKWYPHDIWAIVHVFNLISLLCSKSIC